YSAIVPPKLRLEDKTAPDKRSAKVTQGSKKASKPSQAIELDSQKSQFISESSAPPPPVTLLLHPPPVQDMKPGQYNFFSTKILSGVDQLRLTGLVDKISSGVLIACGNPSLIYFVCGNHVSSMAMVAENGRTHFAVGSIPPNFKLPENINVPNLEDVLKPGKDNSEPKDSSAGAMLWECPICMEKMTTPLKNHLMQRHLYFCLKCSACFVTQAFIQMHDSTCNFQHPASKVLYLCTICRCVFSAIVCFYNHLIETHQNGVTFDETTGQVFPYCATICLENDYLPSLVSDAVPSLETVATDEGLKFTNTNPVTTSRSVVSSPLHSQTEIHPQPTSHKKRRLDESVTNGSKNIHLSSEISSRKIPHSEIVLRDFCDTATLNRSGPEYTDNIGYTGQSISCGGSVEIPPIQIRIEKPVTAEYQRSLPSVPEQQATPQCPTRCIKPTIELVVEQVLDKVRSQTRDLSVEANNSTLNDTLSRPWDVIGIRT
uniref:C2H2-type domain-containing protein n=1 Tax=Romanomermis culicivorax TaxID=13658 RepID=A0A915L5F0_ROMCU